MRRIAIGMFLATTLLSFGGNPKTITLIVQNMSCVTCTITVKKALGKVPGVSAVKINFKQKTAIVTYDQSKTTPRALTKATAVAGYPSIVKQ